MDNKYDVGAACTTDGLCRFTVWAPLAQKVGLHLIAPEERLIAMAPQDRGYFTVTTEAPPGVLYMYRLDGGQDRADPASRFQPQGVFGPSMVTATAFAWNDGCWSGLPLEQYIIYELHVGTFSLQGTFDGVIDHLDKLADLGATAIELMPVAQFPGARNWGYDGVFPFAVQNTYGGPAALKKLVNACHLRGMAVVLDVVYNHLGPEGNYLGQFGPYFSPNYLTPWGQAINFDGAGSDEVKHFFIRNALYWITEFHIDALRLDALHAIVDLSANPFLQQLAAAVHQEGDRLNRRVYLIGESDRNDIRLVKRPELGGMGLDALWNDDYHHALHVALTGEQTGYYRDFRGFPDLVKAFAAGWVYTGQYSVFRGRSHGSEPDGLVPGRFVVFSQNHDQVGNRMLGERMSRLASFEQLKLTAGALLLSPFIPLIFMGEEYGEEAPFTYFVDHMDPQLSEATRLGRRREFPHFAGQSEPPDPKDESAFARCKLNHELRHRGKYRALNHLYRELLRLRKTVPALSRPDGKAMEVFGLQEQQVLLDRRWAGTSHVMAVFNFSDRRVTAELPVPKGQWQKKLDSSEARWGGDGPATQIHSKGKALVSINGHAFVVFTDETAS